MASQVPAPAVSAADSPASIPAGATPALPQPPEKRPQATTDKTTVSPKQAQEADDAYLDGARHVEHRDLAAAIRSFTRAVRLNPKDRDYALALIVTRENYVTELVERSAKASAAGDAAQASKLLAEAHSLDPDNPVVAQHFAKNGAQNALRAGGASQAPKWPGYFYGSIDPSKFPVQDIASTLEGEVELTPLKGKRNIHLHGALQMVAETLYGLYGIKVSLHPSLSQPGPPIDLDMNGVDFAGATRAFDLVANAFAVPVEPNRVVLARDTRENREALMPEYEEAIYVEGHSNTEMQELGNVARTVFGLQNVTASATGGFILVRGQQQVLREVNAVYNDLLGGTPELLFDVSLYEIDHSIENNIGATLPNSVGGFSVASEAESLITSNESLINEAVANGLLTLNGSPLQNLINEVEFLVASGTVTASQYTNLLGVFGNGLGLSGLFLGSSPSFALALDSSDVSILDSTRIMGQSGQPAEFRVGSRYPVTTGTYSTGLSSTLSSSLSGLTNTGSSISALLNQYLGSNSVTVPEIQYEDLGITLKLTPQVLHNNEVSIAINLKDEALGAGSLDGIPVLNNRALTSSILVPEGYTAMLATLVSTEEIKALVGLPGLSELPGFQGTDQDLSNQSTQILITITPHIVRQGRLQIVSRRIETANNRYEPSGGGGEAAGLVPSQH
ncbi:MAG: type II secretion system protein GspD [Acidobacteriaceae bacterium]